MDHCEANLSHSIFPRYTPGMPAMVDKHMAEIIAWDEKDGYKRAVSGFFGAEAQDRARRHGLGPLLDGSGTARAPVECISDHEDHYSVRCLITGVRWVRPARNFKHTLFPEPKVVKEGANSKVPRPSLECAPGCQGCIARDNWIKTVKCSECDALMSADDKDRLVNYSLDKIMDHFDDRFLAGRFLDADRELSQIDLRKLKSEAIVALITITKSGKLPCWPTFFANASGIIHVRHPKEASKILAGF